MSKSPNAFRTISEVADWLGIQAHVLRFWESKFTQVKPIKRAGGRRYYRPADMQLLGGIKKLLHEDGLTIKGVQKILREEGMNHVAAMSVPLDDADTDVDVKAAPEPLAPKAEPAEAVVLPFEPPKEVAPKAPKPATAEEPQAATKIEEETAEAPVSQDMPLAGKPEATPEPESDAPTPEPSAEPEAAPAVEEEPVEAPVVAETPPVEKLEAAPEPEPEAAKTAIEEATETQTPAPAVEVERPAPVVETAEPELEMDFGEDTAVKTDDMPVADVASDTPDATPATAEHTAPEPEVAAAPQEPAKTLPSFMRRPEPTASAPTVADQPAEAASIDNDVPAIDELAVKEKTEAPAPAETAAPEAPAPAPAPKPRVIEMPVLTPESEIHAQAASLTRAQQIQNMDPQTAQKMAPLLAQLAALRDRMAAPHNGA